MLDQSDRHHDVSCEVDSAHDRRENHDRVILVLALQVLPEDRNHRHHLRPHHHPDLPAQVQSLVR